MKLLLMQSQVYLPSLGGGNKANRLLAEGLAERGHECRVVGQALTTRAGPTTVDELEVEMARRSIKLERPEPDLFAFEHNGVRVEAMNFAGEDETRGHMVRRIGELQPDWILVADDRRRLLLESAMSVAPERVLAALQTIVQLPFGPLANEPSVAQTELLRRARGIIVISRFLQDYMREHADLDSELLHFPVYGSPPFARLDNSDDGYVTIFNPCTEKGLEVFLALARLFPAQEFAAVPTWAANDEVLRALETEDNVRILTPSDDIEDILRLTRVVVVPSQWPETFGYIVVDAMLRGIPVLASDVGGLGEAKLGVDYLLPLETAQYRNGTFEYRPQQIAPWSEALGSLLADRDVYRRCSERSHRAAGQFIETADVARFEQFFERLAEEPR